MKEKRFDEAHVIIEQILNIEPNNTDAHIANFLYQLKLPSVDAIASERYFSHKKFRKSPFYERIKQCEETDLSEKLERRFTSARIEAEGWAISAFVGPFCFSFMLARPIYWVLTRFTDAITCGKWVFPFYLYAVFAVLGVLSYIYARIKYR